MQVFEEINGMKEKGEKERGVLKIPELRFQERRLIFIVGATDERGREKEQILVCRDVYLLIY